MKINDIIFGLIEEQNIIGTSKTKPIANAIVKRHPITFYYSGPRKPKKNSVKAGKRIKAEAVALGLHKNSGNLIVRAYVQPPSVSKKGFEKHGWRTFLVNRMSNVEINTNETFDVKKPLYKEGDDKSMNPTYVTSLWTDRPEIKPTELPKQTEPTKEPEKKPEELPQPKPEKKPEKKPEELPQPKPEKKPSKEPEFISKSKFDVDVYNSLKSKIKDIEGEKSISKLDYENSVNDLYKKKEREWIDNQRQIGGNTKPGEGTRNKLKNDSKLELDKLLSNDKVNISDNNDQIKLDESIKRIKTLIFF